jgi:hypothetical protein
MRRMSENKMGTMKCFCGIDRMRGIRDERVTSENMMIQHASWHTVSPETISKRYCRQCVDIPSRNKELRTRSLKPDREKSNGTVVRLPAWVAIEG